jgi:hypothetical protein
VLDFLPATIQYNNALEGSKICRPKELQRILETLDIDEGVRIEKSGELHKMFISKSPSGVYAIQVTSSSSQKHDQDTKVEYLDSAAEVLSMITSIFRKGASSCIY